MALEPAAQDRLKSPGVEGSWTAAGTGLDIGARQRFEHDLSLQRLCLARGLGQAPSAALRDDGWLTAV